jgi:hypothetical protein
VAFIFADSPRLYTSTNPWKITATFHTISSTREEYISTIDSLKASAPPDLKKGQKRTKPEQSHLALIVALEKRIEVIDAELNVSNSFAVHHAENFSYKPTPNCFIFVLNYEMNFYFFSACTKSERRLSNVECSWHKLRYDKLELDDKHKSPIMCTMTKWTVMQVPTPNFIILS